MKNRLNKKNVKLFFIYLTMVVYSIKECQFVTQNGYGTFFDYQHPENNLRLRKFEG
ncbi:hypothetical protein LCGC14_1511650 [marine sediment metagenome]|uniref:Uncharacterized protein n=1 Tax=marine sediment metagenome TaxID=412755 RepID=A0A0F9M2D1_9ZZZZ